MNTLNPEVSALYGKPCILPEPENGYDHVQFSAGASENPFAPEIVEFADGTTIGGLIAVVQILRTNSAEQELFGVLGATKTEDPRLMRLTPGTPQSAPHAIGNYPAGLIVGRSTTMGRGLRDAQQPLAGFVSGTHFSIGRMTLGEEPRIIVQDLGSRHGTRVYTSPEDLVITGRFS